jgi:putative endonuclease
MAWVYILTNRPNGTLYVGVTNDLSRRIYEHREGSVEGFTKRYRLKSLVYFEKHETMPLAIQREKSMKRWPRLEGAIGQRAKQRMARSLRGDSVRRGCPAQGRA